MARVERFENLEVSKSARELVRAVYKATSGSAFSRDTGLRGQIQRASVSVMSNIAEGFERGGDKEFFQFLAQAKGSCGEVRSHLFVAKDQGYLSSDLLESLSQATARTSGMKPDEVPGPLHASRQQAPKKFVRHPTLDGPVFRPAPVLRP